jgi:hypothetical protein
MKTVRQARKTHIVFSLGLLIILLIGLIPRMASGERFFRALWSALTDVRPVEWVMFFTLWYAFAKDNLRKGWFKSSQTLGLADRK